MKRNAIMLVLGVMAALLASQAASTPEATEEAIARKKRLNERTGGLILHPGTGKVVVANVQSKVNSDLVKSTAEVVTKEFRVAVEHDKEPTFTITSAGESIKRTGASAMVFVIDDPNLPFSLIAPEAKWGCVNVAALVTDSPNVEKLQARYKKMFMRTVSSLLGAGASGYKVSVMQSVSSLAELDEIKGIGLDPQALMSIMQRLPKIGITPPRMLPYIKACREGWAPPPTNDVQRTIWEKVKADKERGPTNPITIPPPNAKK